ncbi:MAG TPA: hypothetical protein VFK09_12725 [Gemmatimonadales bacterium]|nr:hypothetical protein [Gemmatimonadales bacterium]
MSVTAPSDRAAGGASPPTGAIAHAPRLVPVDPAAPTRWAGAPSWLAGAALLVLAALCAYALWRAPITAKPLSPDPAAVRGGDLALYSRIVDRVRQGENYYAATRTELVANDYPVGSLFNWRLPTLAWLLAAFPSDAAARWLLRALGLAALAVWAIYFVRTAPPRVAAACVLLAAGLPLMTQLANAQLYHESWGGLLVLLAIGAAANRWYGAGVAAGLAACLVRELALAYAVVALVLALRAGRRREGFAWGLGCIGFAGVMAVHAAAVARVAPGGGHVAISQWIAGGGWRFVLNTATLNGWLLLLPVSWIGVVVPVALAGVLGWRGEPGGRVALTVLAYVTAFLLVGHAYNVMWGMLYSGLLPLGLPFAPAALRDLGRAAARRAA